MTFRALALGSLAGAAATCLLFVGGDVVVSAYGILAEGQSVLSLLGLLPVVLIVPILYPFVATVWVVGAFALGLPVGRLFRHARIDSRPAFVLAGAVLAPIPVLLLIVVADPLITAVLSGILAASGAVAGWYVWGLSKPDPAQVFSDEAAAS